MRLRWPAATVGAMLALAAVAGVTAGCGSSSTSVSAGPVNLRLSADYDTLDPYKSIAAASGELQLAGYDFLVAVDDKGVIHPYLAKSWKVTPTAVTLKVRQDATCDDGSYLTAKAIAASLSRLISPQTQDPNLVSLLGNGPFTVTSSGDTVTLRTRTPYGGMLAGLSSVPIICPAGLRHPGLLKNKMYGSGPYVMTHAQRGSAYTFTRRDGWSWGPRFPGVPAGDPPQSLTFKVVAVDTTAANLLTTGGLDAAQVSGPDIKRLAGDGSLTRSAVRDFGMTFIQYNEAPGHVTADLAVRRALGQAIDRVAWSHAASDGRGNLATSIVPTNDPCYDAGTRQLAPAYDPATARAALMQAGWAPGAGGTLAKDGKPLAVKIVAWEGEQLGPDYVLAALEKIGVKATLAKTDVSTYVESAQKGDFDLSIVPSLSITPTPQINVSFLTGPGGTKGQNWGATQNRVVDHWVAVAGASVGAAACDAWGHVQRALLERADMVPLTSETFDWFTRKGLTLQAISSVPYPWSIRVG